MEKWFWVLGGVAVLLLVGILLMVRRGKISPFAKREFLMSIPERRFFEELKEMVPSNYVVFPQVMLCSLVEVQLKGRDSWRYRNRISQKSLDFVLFEKPYYRPVLAIEYDGKTHDSWSRKRRDEFVDGLLRSCGLPILRVRHGNIEFEKLKGEIDGLLKSGEGKVEVTSPVF